VRNIRFGIFPKLLTVLIVVAVVPMGVVWYFNYRSSVANLTTQIEAQLSHRADAVVSYTDQFVELHLRMLEQAATLDDIKSMDGKRQHAILRSFTDRYPWIYLAHAVGPDGLNTGRSDGKAPIDYRDRVYVQVVLQGAPMGQQVVISKTTGQPAFILSAPIVAKARLVGVIALAMSITDLTKRVTNVKIGESGYAFLLDERGEIIAHPHARGSLRTHPAFIRLPADEERKRLEFTDPATGKRVIAIAQRTRHGWIMVAQQNYDEIYRPVTQGNVSAATVLAIVVAGVLLFSYALAQRFARPIVNFTRIADDISRGDLATAIPETRRSDEIGSLARAIERLSTSVKLSMERLAKT
jgi:methyl-accepting chemotaxis protein